MQLVNKTFLIELIIPGISGGNTGQNFVFPDQPFLRGKFIIGLETYSINDLSLSPLGNPLPSKAQLSNAYLNLYGEDPENQQAFGNWFNPIPFWDMHALSNGTDPYTYEKWQMMPTVIQWEKSNLYLAAPLNNTGNISFLINATYQNSY